MAGKKDNTRRDKFWVGQRVRYRDNPEQRATVISQRERTQYFSKDRLTGKWRFVYRLDCDGYGTRAPEGFHYGAQQHELEPIYDGDQPSSWSKIEEICGWAPAAVVPHG
jgi:hypothetical protein